MKKTTFIAILLVVATVAVVVGYATGVFDTSPSSVSVQTNIQDLQEIPSTTQRAKITPQYLTSLEVQKHSTKVDCWVILDENIYDLTSYILQHPGGQKVILKVCGRDGSEMFNKVKEHLMPFVQEKMKEYLLGAVTEGM